jgi:hypothetical protein
MITSSVLRVFGLLAALGVAGLTPAGVSAGGGQEAKQGEAAGRRDHLVLAVVRNDGILVPFAAFNGRKWSAPWPFLQRRFGPNNIEIPVNLASVPLDWWGGERPGDWRLWPMNSETSRPLTLSTPMVIPIGADRQLGFRTDQPPVLPPVPPFELPFPKIGVAVAGDTPLTKIVTVSGLSGAWKTFAESLREEITKAEDRALGAVSASSNWRHPIKREARAALVAELEAWYITPIGPGDERLSYIEAVKKYPLQPDDKGCGLETFVSGWVYHGSGQQKKAKAWLSAVVTYCDRRGVSYMLPFGQLKVNDRVHWIVQMSGRDHEWYAVVEATPDRARYVAEFQAGSMPLPR